MRFRLRKTSPRLTSTKEIVETRDGDVARLVALNDKPLSPADEQDEQARLETLLNDPSRQRHRKQSEDEDIGHRPQAVAHVARRIPLPILRERRRPGRTRAEIHFRPNPEFNPPDLETRR